MTDTNPTGATIGEMCVEYGVTARALRFYEAKGLLAPHRDGQRRFYRLADRARLKLILQGKRFGFSLAEIRELLELYESGPGQVKQLSATLERAAVRLEAMQAQRAELDAAVDELKEQMALVERMIAQRSVGRAAE